MRYLLSIAILLWAFQTGRYIHRWIQDGEAYLVMTVGGDGLFGGANRADEPALFWFNIVVQCLIVTGVVTFGLWFVLGNSEF